MRSGATILTTLRGARWAAERPKRFLAAPIAVGTVDQALLSAVRVRHAQMRCFCLSRSLLVVDEVHASDTYMGSLLANLLEQHRNAGGEALLLSATLGAAARMRLLLGSGKKAKKATPRLAACRTRRASNLQLIEFVELFLLTEKSQVQQNQWVIV